MLPIYELERVLPSKGVPLLFGKEELSSPCTALSAVCNVLPNLRKSQINNKNSDEPLSYLRLHVLVICTKVTPRFDPSKGLSKAFMLLICILQHPLEMLLWYLVEV